MDKFVGWTEASRLKKPWCFDLVFREIKLVSQYDLMRATGEVAQLVGRIFIRIAQTQLIVYLDLCQKIQRSITPV